MKSEARTKSDLKFWKTRLCIHGASCAKLHCSYAHNLNELRQSVCLDKTRFCEHKKQGYCHRGQACKFAHSLAELRSTVDMFKTSMCLESRCMQAACRYAHLIEEILIVHRWIEEGKLSVIDGCISHKDYYKLLSKDCKTDPLWLQHAVFRVQAHYFMENRKAKMQTNPTSKSPNNHKAVVPGGLDDHEELSYPNLPTKAAHIGGDLKNDRRKVSFSIDPSNGISPTQRDQQQHHHLESSSDFNNNNTNNQFDFISNTNNLLTGMGPDYPMKSSGSPYFYGDNSSSYPSGSFMTAEPSSGPLDSSRSLNDLSSDAKVTVLLSKEELNRIMSEREFGANQWSNPPSVSANEWSSSISFSTNMSTPSFPVFSARDLPNTSIISEAHIPHSDAGMMSKLNSTFYPSRYDSKVPWAGPSCETLEDEFIENLLMNDTNNLRRDQPNPKHHKSQAAI